jgi:hypothetical protein
LILGWHLGGEKMLRTNNQFTVGWPKYIVKQVYCLKNVDLNDIQYNRYY